jgi:GTP pyrophosphokinase
MFLRGARRGRHAGDRHALRGGAEALPPEPEIHMRKSRAGDSRILVVGVDKLLTQMGTCCKPMPPDAITGFVTRGKGISIHRVECVNFRNMAARNPERVISAEWGPSRQTRSIRSTWWWMPPTARACCATSHVTAVKTLSRGGTARMDFTVELPAGYAIPRVMTLLGDVQGVIKAQRV